MDDTIVRRLFDILGTDPLGVGVVPCFGGVVHDGETKGVLRVRGLVMMSTPIALGYILERT